MMKLIFTFVIYLFLPVNFLLAQSYNQPTVKLSISVEGLKRAENLPVTISADKPLQLKVDAQLSSGDTIDITHDSKTHYQVMTPWNLKVNKDGLVSARFQERTIPTKGSLYKGYVAVFYGKNGDSEVGSSLIEFAVTVDKQFYNLAEKVIEPSIAPKPFEPVKKVDPKIIPPDFFKPELLNKLNDVDKDQNAENPDQKDDNFIDYQQLEHASKAESPASFQPVNSEMTDEERRLYNDALKQP